MSSYQERQEARRERLEGAAEKAKDRSSDAFKRSDQITGGIPMGQPILVGHHSERRHRGALERSDSLMRKGFAEKERANELASRAESVGTAGIASDDPDAVIKLAAELTAIEVKIERMKAQNKAFRKGGIKALDEAAKREWLELQRLTPYHKQPYPAYALSNAGANARRIEKRIEQLSIVATLEPLKIAGPDFDLTEDRDEGRFILKIHGAARLSEERYSLTRQHAFLWSGSRKAFVRKITVNALFGAKRLAQALTETAAK
jgi:Domain of unknown function (DUF3560)